MSGPRPLRPLSAGSHSDPALLRPVPHVASVVVQEHLPPLPGSSASAICIYGRGLQILAAVLTFLVMRFAWEQQQQAPITLFNISGMPRTYSDLVGAATPSHPRVRKRPRASLGPMEAASPSAEDPSAEVTPSPSSEATSSSSAEATSSLSAGATPDSTVEATPFSTAEATLYPSAADTGALVEAAPSAPPPDGTAGFRHHLEWPWTEQLPTGDTPVTEAGDPGMVADGRPRATPFPPRYTSRLVQAARARGIQVPDVWERGRLLSDEGCPPFLGGVLHQRPLRAPRLSDVGHTPIALVSVSHRSPQTLRNTLMNWNRSGLLQLVDEKILFLNAARTDEIAWASAAGFRVFTADDDLDWLVARHGAAIVSASQGDSAPVFPFKTRGDDGKHSTFLAVSALLSFMEAAAPYVLFLEKDFIVRADLSHDGLIRQLLASVAASIGDTPVVRLRDADDPDRAGFPDCCSGVCGSLVSGFDSAYRCGWSTQMDWLHIFSPSCPGGRDNIEAFSKNEVKRCLDERPKASSPGVRAVTADGLAPTTSPGAKAVTADALAPTTDADKVQPAEARQVLAAASLAEPVQAGGRPDGASRVLQVAPSPSASRPSGIPPVELLCFSTDFAGWSNNAALIRKSYWLKLYSNSASLTSSNNADFEDNSRTKGCTAKVMFPYEERDWITPGERSPFWCQLLPGPFQHYEVDTR